LRELEAVKAAPLPYVLFGDNVGRFSPSGLELIAEDSGDSLAAVPNAAYVRWLTDTFAGDPIGEVAGGYSTPGVNRFSHAVLRAFADDFDAGAGKLGVFNLAGNYWETLLSIQNTDPLQPLILAKRISSSLTNIFAVERVDDSNYRVLLRQGGAMTELAGGGAMETANTGQFLIPTGPSAGNFVRSGAADAYGSWFPLPGGDAVAPAAPTETSNSANVAMPATVAAGDLLVVLAARNGGAVGTGSGFTSLGSGANTINLHVFYKVAVGNEGGTTVSFANCGVAQVYRFLAANYSGIPTISTAATGTSTAADPTAVTPPAGRFLSLAVAAIVGDLTVNVTASPSGYSTIDNRQQGVGSDAAGASIGSAYLVDSGTTENPTAFTNGSAAWVAFVVAIGAPNAVTEDTYITDVALVPGGTPTYAQIQLGTGAAGAESAIGTLKLTDEGWEKTLQAVIPVTAGTRLSARIATSASAADHFLTLGMLNQDDVA
jgi:hypothetical protein